MLSNYANRAPLGRIVTSTEVGNVAAFLCSDLASGVTGEITYVDGGFNTAAMSVEEYADTPLQQNFANEPLTLLHSMVDKTTIVTRVLL